MYKKWTIITLIITSVALCLTAGLAIIIDPFFNFHKPISECGYLINNEIYQNPGIAKNFDYDAVLLGSSMVENFKTTEFDEQFGVNTVKLSYSGARAYNIKVISDIVFENRDIKTVFWGLDTVRLNADPNEPRFPLPEYLYSPSKIDDVKYVFNKSVLRKAIKVLKSQVAGKKNTSMDDAYAWYPALSHEFIAADVAENYMNKRSEIVPVEQEPSENLVINIEQNFLPMIEEHPDTEFVIFFPPYSIMYWDTLMLQGVLNDRIDSKELLIKELISFDNVKIYDFQADELIICDIDNYKDYSHYSTDINSYMVSAMAEEIHLLNEENYEDELDKLYNLVLDTDVPELLSKYIEASE